MRFQKGMLFFLFTASLLILSCQSNKDQETSGSKNNISTDMNKSNHQSKNATSSPAQQIPAISFSDIQDDNIGYDNVQWGTDFETFASMKGINESQPTFHSCRLFLPSIGSMNGFEYAVPLNIPISVNSDLLYYAKWEVLPEKYYRYYNVTDKVSYIFADNRLFCVCFIVKYDQHDLYMNKLSETNEKVSSGQKNVSDGSNMETVAWTLFKRNGCNTRIYLIQHHDKKGYMEKKYDLVLYIPNTYYMALQEEIEMGQQQMNKQQEEWEMKQKEEENKQLERIK